MYYDRIKTRLATGTGTGNITWTVAEAQFALPPASINELVTYTVLDRNGTAWETGLGTLSESGGTYTLTRGGSQSVSASSNSGSAISLTTSSNHTFYLGQNAASVNAPPGSMQTISTVTASADTEMIFALPATGYTLLEIQVDSLVSSTGQELNARVSTDDGVTYKAGGSDYDWGFHYCTPTSGGEIHEPTDISIHIHNANAANGAGVSDSGRIRIYHNADTSFHTNFMWEHMYYSNNVPVLVRGMGRYAATTAITHVRLSCSAGTFTGSASLFGRVA